MKLTNKQKLAQTATLDQMTARRYAIANAALYVIQKMTSRGGHSWFKFEVALALDNRRISKLFSSHELKHDLDTQIKAAHLCGAESTIKIGHHCGHEHYGCILIVDNRQRWRERFLAHNAKMAGGFADHVGIL